MHAADVKIPTRVGLLGLSGLLAAMLLVAAAQPTPTRGDVGVEGPLPLAVSFIESEFGLATSEAIIVLEAQAASIQADARLRQAYGSAIIGTRIETETGALVVSVADPAAAEAISSEGFIVDLQRDSADVSAAREEATDLLVGLGISGFIVAEDPAAAGVVVQLSVDLDGSLLAEAESRLASLGFPVTVVAAEMPESYVRPGDEFANGEFSDSNCTFGFFLLDDFGTYYQTTATHCMSATEEVGDEVYHGIVGDAPREAIEGGLSNPLRGHYDFLVPNSDLVLVDLVDSEEGLVDNTVPLDGGSIAITGFAEPIVGMAVCSVGMTSNPEGECGVITEANFNLGLPTGFGEAFQYNIEGAGGDSGGPIFTPDGLAVGLIQGGINGSGDEPVTYGVPIARAIDEGYSIAAEEVQTVHLEKRGTSFGLDGNRGAENGQNVYLWDSDLGNINQLWAMIPRGNGYYSFQKSGTDHCLDGGKNGANGQTIYLWNCGSTNWNQQWKVIEVSGGYVRLEKRNAPDFSIDGGRNGANGQDVYMWDTDDGTNVNQHFTLTVVD